jgi:hypothetical protein
MEDEAVERTQSAYRPTLEPLTRNAAGGGLKRSFPATDARRFFLMILRLAEMMTNRPAV